MVYCFFFTDWQAYNLNATSKNHSRKAMIRMKYTILKTEVAHFFQKHLESELRF